MPVIKQTFKIEVDGSSTAPAIQDVTHSSHQLAKNIKYSLSPGTSQTIDLLVFGTINSVWLRVLNKPAQVYYKANGSGKLPLKTKVLFQSLNSLAIYNDSAENQDIYLGVIFA